MNESSQPRDFLQEYRQPLALGAVGLLLIVASAVFDVMFLGLVGLGCLVGCAMVAIRLADAPAPVPVATVPVPDTVRAERLQQHLSQDIAVSRGRIESVTPYSAVVVTGQKVNHVLHLLVSVLLCGLWLPVWLLIAVSGGEKRHVLTVDPCGNVIRR